MLNEIRPEKAKGWVLPGVRSPDQPVCSLDNMIARIMNIAGLEGVTAHTLRRSFASVAADLNYSDSTIGAILGHSGGNITSRYTHRLGSVLITASNNISDELISQLFPKQKTNERQEAVAELPPFRPDSRHKQKGSSTGLGIGLCLTTIDTLNC